jgi:hypothetical protein
MSVPAKDTVKTVVEVFKRGVTANTVSGRARRRAMVAKVQPLVDIEYIANAKLKARGATLNLANVRKEGD